VQFDFYFRQRQEILILLTAFRSAQDPTQALSDVNRGSSQEDEAAVP
jgi:hypothetical protein